MALALLFIIIIVDLFFQRRINVLSGGSATRRLVGKELGEFTLQTTKHCQNPSPGIDQKGRI